MSSTSDRIWPSVSSSCTLTVNFSHRANENTGTYTTLTLVPSLLIVVPSGYHNHLTLTAIRAAVLEHLLNNGIKDVYQPVSGTAEEAIRAALELADIPGQFASTTLRVFFNGQFGTVATS